MTRWAILAGEYPPQPGGVSDYTRLVAAELAAGGDAVRVFAPPCAVGGALDGGVEVVRLPDHFGPRGLVALDRLLRAPRPDRILIQYVPQAFGWKGMNVLFAAWTAARTSALAPMWVMFHEVAFPLLWRPARYALLAGVTRVMAGLLVMAAARVFVSIPAWRDPLHRVCPWGKRAEWLPVPSVAGTLADPASVSAVRRGFPPEAEVVGHLGTFGKLLVGVLEPAACDLLRRRPHAHLLLIGRNSGQFRAHLRSASPELSHRVTATGELPREELAAYLRACDVLLQPYPDGISSRRTSAMAGLATGVPVVSNLGRLSEPLWAGVEGVRLAPTPSPEAIADATCALLDLSPADRSAITVQATLLYQTTFSLEHTISRLRSVAP